MHQPRWSLTWPGRFLVLLLAAGAGFLVLLNLHDFLAVDAPVKTSVLVIEGWVPRYAVTNFVAKVVNDYSDIYTTGGVTLADGKSRNDADTYASVTKTRLMRAGVPAAKLHVVPSWIVKRDRTYSSALALREWCRTNNVQLSAFNVVTLGPHARRSRLLHEKAFGKEVKVGIIALTNVEYDPDHWWRYSEGVKEVLSESAAYLYSRFFFSPE
ncbi:MAG TPA: YdcF family protein [Verrucomicrobiae bacterium]